MHSIKPYILVPNLIPQPTWGGEYIAGHKKVSERLTKDLKLGQSYELFRESMLSMRSSSANNPTVAIADPLDPTTAEIMAEKDEPFSLQFLIDMDPVAVLGKDYVQRLGTSMEILIKLNQAQGNSFQLHVKKPTGDDRWLPKPESWYFLEPGIVTLGLKPNVDLDAYKQTCILVEQKSQEISQAIQDKTTSLEEGRRELADFIKQHNPHDFVNTISVGKKQGVDLSACGIHHSWEENSQTHPLGNIVYEVQKNVYDPDCTIRSFDKGKIKDDGQIRDVHIQDYFDHLDTTPEANRPQNHFRKGKILKKTPTYTIKEIFAAADYRLEIISLNAPVANKHTTTKNFHHIFVQSGSIKVQTKDLSYVVTQGFSLFLPASTGEYILKPHKCHHASILKTTV